MNWKKFAFWTGAIYIGAMAFTVIHYHNTHWDKWRALQGQKSMYQRHVENLENNTGLYEGISEESKTLIKGRLENHLEVEIPTIKKDIDKEFHDKLKRFYDPFGIRKLF